MSTKELYSIREWAPLNIIERIPSKIIRGLFPVDLNITCVDAVDDFLVLGSDGGLVFWYNRHTGDVQKLKAEIITRITCVKIVNSVEFMVAAGDSNGQVSVFQIQKQLPPDLNLVAPCTRNKPIERYTIRDLHGTAISCCEWSKNGMKLFSGDRQGVVVLTEFDYQTHISKSVEILRETYEIVQLSVHQSYLLVSTLYRSIICQRNDSTGQWLLTQVGKKDRKQLTDCGGILIKQNAKHPLIICGRPGLRFWIGDVEGNVEKTLLFKDAIILSPTWEIPILNPKSMKFGHTSNAVCNDSTVALKNFCTLYVYTSGQDKLVVTHDETTLYILNLDRLRVEAVAKGFRKILDFCVCGKEIFVLEGERSLLRLAPMPEKPNKTAKVIFNPFMPPPVPLLGAAAYGAFESPVEFEPEEEAVIKAEECFELPPVEGINLNIPIELAVESPRAEQNRRLEIFKQISTMDFDQSILHSSGISMNKKKKRKKSVFPDGIVEIGHAVSGEQTNNEVYELPKLNSVPLSKTTKPTLMDASFCLQVDDSELNAPSEVLTTSLKVIEHQKVLEENPNSLAQELKQAENSVNPQTEQKPSKSESLIPILSPLSTSASNNQLTQVETLKQAYPKLLECEDAGVQTTPCKKNYYLQDEDTDYSAGQPIDDICQALHIAARVASNEDLTNLDGNIDLPHPPPTSPETLKFISTQPINDEIGSFLIDFNRARDPLRTSPPQSADSATSSEWEFLDN